MNLVVDASVAIKWVVPEEQEASAEALLLQGLRWIAPEFLLVEAANVLRSKLLRGHLDATQAREGFEFIASTIGLLVPDRDLASRALEIAVEINHSVYDCMYIACAEREGAEMITADRRLVGKLGGSPYSSRVQALPF